MDRYGLRPIPGQIGNQVAVRRNRTGTLAARLSDYVARRQFGGCLA